MPKGRSNTIRSILGRVIIGENGCCIWPGAVNNKGYGNVKWKGVNVKVYKLLYEQFIGSIPEGYDLHHTCENKLCCNPYCLQVLSDSDHAKIHQGNGFPLNYCKRGHEFTEANTYIDPRGCRICRECKRIRRKQLYDKYGKWF